MRRDLLFLMGFMVIGIAVGWFFSQLTPGTKGDWRSEDERKERQYDRSTTLEARASGTHARRPPYPRIISAAPSITEILFALGMGAYVVGVTDYCHYPPEAHRHATKIGGLYNPNRERILRLKPDLILHVGTFDDLTSFAALHRIRTIGLSMRTLEEIRIAVRILGDTLGCTAVASEVVQRFDDELAAIRQRVGCLPRKRVFLCTEHRPSQLSTVGTCDPKSFLAELLFLAGGENIFSDVEGSWPQISKEALLKRAPEVILELHPRGMGSDASTFAILREDWSALVELPAVQRGAIFFLDDDFLFIPSLRAPKIAERFAQILHPEAFCD